MDDVGPISCSRYERDGILNDQYNYCLAYKSYFVMYIVDGFEGTHGAVTQAGGSRRVPVSLYAKQKHLGCKKMRGQSEATLQTGMCDQKL